MMDVNRDESLDDTVEFPTPESEAPSSIGAYRVLRPLRYGSVTRLYEVASLESPDRRLVVKLLQKNDQESKKWFAYVAYVMNVLDHPNIVPCDSLVSIEDRCFIVMPFVEGSDLRETARKDGGFDTPRLIHIVQSVALALDYAHRRGVVHGNLHPKHILLDNSDHVWLIGFAELGPEYSHDFPFGNPHHLAPEQLGFNSTTPATDIYAFAEVCYLCLCGAFPFANVNGITALLEQKRSGPIPSIREYRPDLSKSVDEILQRGMALSPDERYPSAGEFADVFSAALGSTPKRR